MKEADRRFYAGKTLVITGASSGIGQDFAEYIAPAGVKLALVARRAERLQELAQRCQDLGSRALIIPGDVSSLPDMEKVRDAVVGEFGLPDIVIGNAGVGGLNPGWCFDLEIHRRTVDINIMGLAYSLIPFVPAMVERGSGQLVGVSSLAAFRGLPCAGSYSTTKAAQATFLESLRVDLRPRGISVSSIHPGFVRTPMTDHEDFDMPFKIPVRKSSELIARAIRRRRSVYLYPWQMRVLTWFNRNLPNWLYDRMLPKLSGQRSDVRPKML